MKFMNQFNTGSTFTNTAIFIFEIIIVLLKQMSYKLGFRSKISLMKHKKSFQKVIINSVSKLQKTSTDK